MKELHKFTVKLPKEVDKSETIDRDGQKVTETRKVIEDVPHVFILKKPSRSESDSLRLFYGATMKKAVDAGLITKAVLVSRHIDGAGALLSKETAKRISDLTITIESLKNDIIQLGIVDGDAEKLARQSEYLSKFVDAQRELQAIESSNSVIFNNTAETYAQEKSNLWLILNQTYIEVNGNPVPYFKGAKFEDKENYLESLEDSNDPLHLKASPWLSTFWGYYAVGAASTPEQFAALEAEIVKEQEVPKVETEAKKATV
jgi:hypothetical protein